MGKAWHSQSTEALLAELASPEGLSSQKAAKRLTTSRPNELTQGKRISPWQIFLDQFKSLLNWILIGADVVSGALGEVVDAIAILAIVVPNAVIGFYQEFNAEKSIAAQAKVRRDGKIISIPASGIVKGDILALEAGDGRGGCATSDCRLTPVH